MPKAGKIIIPRSLGNVGHGKKGNKKRGRKGKKSRRKHVGRLPVPDIPITQRHGEFKDGLKPPTKDSFPPVPGTNPTNDVCIFFHYVTPKDHLFRFTPEPLQIDYRMYYWNKERGHNETPPAGLNEQGRWLPYSGDGRQGYLPPQSRLSAIFEEILLYLDDRIIQILPGAWHYEGFYGAAHKYFIPRDSLLKYFGNNEAFIPATQFRKIETDGGVALDGRAELLKAGDFTACEDGKISMRFHFDSTPFLCQGKNYLLASRQGESYSITNAWLPPETKIKISMRKRDEIGSLVESLLNDDIYLNSTEDVTEENHLPLYTKMKINDIKFHFEVAEIAPGIEYKSLLPSEYYFDLPRIYVHSLPPNMNVTSVGFDLTAGVKLCYIWMMPSYQLIFNRNSDRRMSYRAFFPPGLHSFGLKLNHIPIIFREPLANFSTLGDSDCPGTRTLELYLKEKNWLSGTWPYIRPIGARNYSYRNLIPVDLTQHKINGGEVLTVDLNFADGTSPTNWNVMCITVEEVVVRKEANFGWKVISGMTGK